VRSPSCSAAPDRRGARPARPYVAVAAATWSGTVVVTRRSQYGHAMDRATALRRLPTAYSLALSWREAGIADEDIASRLEIPLESLPSFFRIAEQKLAEILRDDGGGPPGGESRNGVTPGRHAHGQPSDRDSMIDALVRQVIRHDISRALRADGLGQLAALLGPSGRAEVWDDRRTRLGSAAEVRSVTSAA
jgi:hypothetical protein